MHALHATEVPCLACHQEEANKLIFLDAHLVANSGFARVVIHSADNDVAVIGCDLAAKITAQLIWQAATKHCCQFVNVINIAHSLGLRHAKLCLGCMLLLAVTVLVPSLLGGEGCRAMQLLGTEFAVFD